MFAVYGNSPRVTLRDAIGPVTVLGCQWLEWTEMGEHHAMQPTRIIFTLVAGFRASRMEVWALGYFLSRTFTPFQALSGFLTPRAWTNDENKNRNTPIISTRRDIGPSDLATL